MKARRRRKQEKLTAQQAAWYRAMWSADPFPMRLDEPITETTVDEFVAHELRSGESPYDVLRQRDHELRVYGHDIYSSECACNAEDLENLIFWNQAPSLYMSNGSYYHRKTQHRRGRNR